MSLTRFLSLLICVHLWLVFPASAASPSPAVTPSGWINEWSGPHADWANLKTDYGAVGDGVTNDATALQSALDDLATPGHSAVLYIPNGTYKFTTPLRLALRHGVRIVGQDPALTILKPSGSAFVDTSALLIDRVDYSRFERFTIDGGDIHGITGINQSMQVNGGIFDTGNDYTEVFVQHCDYGWIFGVKGYGGTETTLTRCRAHYCHAYGVYVFNPNSLDNIFQDGEIDHCLDGIGNNAGQFHAYANSLHDNTNDFHVKNFEYFSFRFNVSKNSGRFLLADNIANGNPNPITVQGNLVIDPLIYPTVDIGNTGQLLLMDNTFLTPTNVTVVRDVFPRCNSFSIGNIFTATNPLSVAGRLITIDNRTGAARPANLGMINLTPVATNLNRHIRGVSPNASGVAIQEAIDSVTNLIGQRPIVYVPQGTNIISTTLILPAGADIQLEGAGPYTVFRGTTAKPIIQLNAPAVCALRNFAIVDASVSATAIVANVSHGKLWTQRLQVTQAEDPHGAAVIVRNCTNATIDLLNFEHKQSVNGVIVDNSTAAVHIRGTAASDESGVVYTATNSANLVVEDVFYQSSVSNTYLQASGTGFVGLQGIIAAHDALTGNHVSLFFNNWTGTGLVSQALLYNKVAPTSGSGLVWVNGVGYFNVIDPYSPAVGLANFNANNNALYGTNGTSQVPDFAPVNTNLIRSAMAQLRSTTAAQNPDTNSCIIANVSILQVATGLLLK